MRATPIALFVCLLLMAALTGPAASQEQGESLTEVNKKLTNPVSETWSISFQQNNYRISTIPGQGDRWNSNLNFQPVLPVALIKPGEDIARQLYQSQNHARGAECCDRI